MEHRRRRKGVGVRLARHCLGLAGLMAIGPLAAQETALIPFELEDQFERTYHGSDYSDRIVVVIGSDRDGSEFNARWGEAIHDALDGVPGFERVSFIPVAHLVGVPFFLKGMIRGRFPKEPERWALMDWDGVFDEAYGLVPGATNVFVFDGAGQLVQRAHGRELDDAVLRGIVSPLRILLAPSGAPAAEPSLKPSSNR